MKLPFSKSNLLKIVNLFRGDFKLPLMKGLPHNPIQQVCLTTSVFANGSFQHVAGHLAGVKQKCACITISKVSHVLNQKFDNLVAKLTESEMIDFDYYLRQQFKV